jgi:hypothetical protein
MTSPRATGAPHSARALNSAVAQDWAVRVPPRDPSGSDATLRARRSSGVGADALWRRIS